MMSPSAPPSSALRAAASGDRVLRTERDFNASRERVWRAFTDPEQVVQWWGRGNQLAIERMELERGGHWRFVETAPDGVHGFEGRYREVTPPQRIVLTFDWDGMPGYPIIVTTTLEELGNERTRVITESLFITGADRDQAMHAGMTEGMSQSYAALEELLKKTGRP
jgi:uncharacterized protein YndB with AHSA1/START domain